MIALTRMSQQANHPLPAGFQLDDYCIEHQLSLGGFSIVYVATDSQGKRVAIKEYLPNTLALRSEGGTTPIISEDHLPAFRYGMKCFFEEGRALAGLSHPNVIRVLNFFRANETVYMVMEYEHGRTLQELIQGNRSAVTENFIRNVFTKMLNGLREVHSHRLLHLDLKPSNVYMRNNHVPVLIDFGAARQTLACDTPMLKPMYTPGFASPEHYHQRDLLGPWSDIYSVGASMYACISGNTPQPANDRMEKDRMVPAMVRWEGQYSDQLLETIDWCLCLNHRYRPQSVFALQKALTEPVVAPPATATSTNAGESDLAAAGGRQTQENQRRMKFTIYQESRTGKRANNEDRLAYCYSREALLMVVADGMGGHYYGEVAAQIAVQTLTEAFPNESRPRLRDPFMFLQKGMLNAHRGILDFAGKHHLLDSPRTTCVACIVQNNVAYWAHSGDSRLYLLRNGKALAQTRDHSRVRLLVDQGVISEEQMTVAPRPQQDLRLPGWSANARDRVFAQDHTDSGRRPGPLHGRRLERAARRHAGDRPEIRRSDACSAGAD
ncbi:MAG: protein kinase [Chitinophagaceae bacterium]